MNSRLHIRIASLVLAGLATVAGAAAQEKPDPNRVAAQRTLAILQESAAWQDLFNGTDLSGWKGDTAGYEIQDGVLICKKGGKNLITEKQFG
ncbi:MAG: DUF1080 domain-containing protein, partial [Planctomycetaceae bacterium]|nr:DUF1080 domain-containing protein [Planctomycetaceae bacterium]